MRVSCFCLAATLLSAAAATAQLRFVEPGKRHLPVADRLTSDVGVADLDGDGDLDVVVANAYAVGKPHRDVVLWNDGIGVFRVTLFPDTGIHNSRSVALADFDNDGDVDVFFGRQAQTVYWNGLNGLFLNDGKGKFTDVSSTNIPAAPDMTTFAVAFDADGDKDVDILVGNTGLFGPPTQLLVNNGKAKFTVKSVPSVVPYAATVFDADRDKDIDVAMVAGGTVVLWLNDGKAGFQAASGLPATPQLKSIDSGDINGDGKVDLVLAVDGTFNTTGQNQVWLGDGNGGFKDVTATSLPRLDDATQSVLLVDIDGDRDLDLFVSNLSEPDRLYLNLGPALFRDVSATRLPNRATATMLAAAADLDGDKRIDLLLGMNGFNALYFQDSQWVFRDASPQPRFPAQSLFESFEKVEIADFDGDGKQDVYLLSTIQDRLFLGDGVGGWSEAPNRVPVEKDYSYVSAAGDLDADGDIDLVIGTTPQLYLQRNSKTGFVKDTTSLPASAKHPRQIALGDVDGDGDLDLFLVRSETTSRQALFLNNGRGVFTDASQQLPAKTGQMATCELFDADNDGDLDAVIGLTATNNLLWLNDGKGNFTDVSTRLPPETNETADAVAGDLTGDGIADLYYAVRNYLLGPAQPARLLAGDGRGGFRDVTKTSIDLLSEATRMVALVDLDTDGDLDILQVEPIAVGHVRINRTRQVIATRVARTGRILPVELSANAGNAVPGQFALPFVGVGRGTPVVVPPYGTWWLGAAPIALPAMVIPAPAGTTMLPIVIPANTTLLGTTFGIQALILHSLTLADWRLSNADFETIR